MTSTPEFIVWNGRRIHRSRLTDQQVAAAEMIAISTTYTEAAKKMGIHIGSLQRLRHGLDWKSTNYGIADVSRTYRKQAQKG